MLEGEVALQRGNLSAASKHLSDALVAADFFQIHESQARVFAAAGRWSDAAEQARWMLAHRGQGLIECEHCSALSVLDGYFALYSLAQAYEALGQGEQAREPRERFEAWWRGDEGAEVPPRLRDYSLAP